MGFSSLRLGRCRVGTVWSPLCSRTQLDRKMMRNEDRRRCKAPFSDLRHTSSKRAAQHTMNAEMLRQLGGVKSTPPLVRRRRVVRQSFAQDDA